MSRRLLRILRYFSLPLFLLSLAAALRTATVHAHDSFNFGINHRWVCTVSVYFPHIFVYLETGEPPFDPVFNRADTSWFFYHSAGGGAVSRGSIIIDATDHHYGILSWVTGHLAGRAVQRNFFLSLPYAPLITLLLTSLIQLHWCYHFIKRRRAQSSLPEHPCPTCNYDLRAHNSGEKCPECGTVIPTRL